MQNSPIPSWATFTATLNMNMMTQHNPEVERCLLPMQPDIRLFVTVLRSFCNATASASVLKNYCFSSKKVPNALLSTNKPVLGKLTQRYTPKENSLEYSHLLLLILLWDHCNIIPDTLQRRWRAEGPNIEKIFCSVSQRKVRNSHPLWEWLMFGRSGCTQPRGEKSFGTQLLSRQTL